MIMVALIKHGARTIPAIKPDGGAFTAIPARETDARCSIVLHGVDVLGGYVTMEDCERLGLDYVEM